MRWFGAVKLEHKEKVTNQFYMRNMMPVGVTMALTLACGNAVYLYLGVALIQMLKAFTCVRRRSTGSTPRGPLHGGSRFLFLFLFILRCARY